jgi:hypothetical protein
MGLPNNNKAQNMEALRGNLGALLSVALRRATVWGAKQQSWDATATLENPDDPVTEPLPSAWLIRQLQDWVNDPGVERAVYNLCAYGPPHWKRERIEGVLPGLEKLSKDCQCGKPHVPLIGAKLTRSAAAYPLALMEAYGEIWANFMLAQFERLAPPTLEEPTPIAVNASSDVIHNPVKLLQGSRSKKVEREQQNLAAIGGMRRLIVHFSTYQDGNRWDPASFVCSTSTCLTTLRSKTWRCCLEQKTTKDRQTS